MAAPETDHSNVDDLVRAAQQGDRAALEALLVRSAPQVLRFAQRMCRSRGDADDVLQDALFSASRELAQFRGESSFSSWLFTLARSACARRYRRTLDKAGMAVPLDEDAHERVLSSPAPSPEDELSAHETARMLDAAMAQLDEAAREVLLLRDVEGLTAPEVAQVLGITVDAVKSRLHRARGALRERLEPAIRIDDANGALCNHIAMTFSTQLEGDLSALDCAAMEKHVAGCRRCEAACSSLKRTLKRCQVAGGEGGAVPANVQQLVRKAIADATAPRTSALL
jgi:RNA polymerase sigma-70 factor (ECF subfamily)